MKILIIKLSALGDIVQVFPALSYLRSKYPFAQIDWIVEPAGASLVQSHPAVDQVHICPLRDWLCQGLLGWRLIRNFFKSMPKYSLIWDFQGNLKSAYVLASVRGMKKIGFDRHHVAEWPNLWFTHHRVALPSGMTRRQEYLGLIQGFFRTNEPIDEYPTSLRLNEEEKKKRAELPRDHVIVCPFAQWKNKCLPIEQWTTILQNEHRPISLLWGSASEQIEARQIQKELKKEGKEVTLLPSLSLPLMQHLFAQSALVVAMDSLPLHLAATTSTPTWSFFGPSSLSKYKPDGLGHQGWMGCCPFGQKFDRRCRYLRTCKDAPCIRSSVLSMEVHETE